MAGAVGGLHGVEGLEDLLLRYAFYIAADGRDGGHLARQVPHNGQNGGRRILPVLAEDVRALLAHEHHRSWEGPEDRDGIVGVAAEQASLLQLQ